MRVPDESYSRNASRALNLISTFSLILFAPYTKMYIQIIRKKPYNYHFREILLIMNFTIWSKAILFQSLVLCKFFHFSITDKPFTRLDYVSKTAVFYKKQDVLALHVHMGSSQCCVMGTVLLVFSLLCCNVLIVLYLVPHCCLDFPFLTTPSVFSMFM